MLLGRRGPCWRLGLFERGLFDYVGFVWEDYRGKMGELKLERCS